MSSRRRRNDVRVIKYVVQIIPQVRGRVIEVPVEPNRLVKKGELLFRIDPTPYQNELAIAKAQARGGRGASSQRPAPAWRTRRRARASCASS